MSRPLTGEPPALWDLVVRSSHWIIAVVVIGNAVFTGGGSTVHVWLGWIGMTALALRLLWGLVGPAEARFAAFPPRPRAAVLHLRDLARRTPGEYPSHNPAGAVMVYALWSTLAAVILAGLVMTSGATPMEVARQKAAVAAGDWAALIVDSDDAADGSDAAASGILSRETKKAVKELHEMGGNLLLLLAVLHVGGVLAESLVLKRNLVKPMLTGDTRSPGRRRTDATQRSG
ncbi:MAG: cytochrome b/b6 domain-containing protein [Rhodobacteraceae bacterium]|nr:cytochrome b/b6 domain-containing protein [Paracoccaceae bacterium]